MSDVAQIAGRLAKAQRRMVLDSERGGRGSMDQACGAEVHGAGRYAVARALVAANLGDIEESPGMYPSALYFNNAVGLQVRDHLMNEGE